MPKPLPEPVETDAAARARKLEEMRRRTSVGPFDVDAPELVGWLDMPPEARAAAAAAAIFAGWRFIPEKVRDRRAGDDDPDRLRSMVGPEHMRYDRRARIVFVIREDPYVKDANRKVATRPVPRTADDSVMAVRAAFGQRAEEIMTFIRRRG